MNMFIHQHRNLFFSQILDLCEYLMEPYSLYSGYAVLILERKFFMHSTYISFSFLAEDQFKVQVTNVPNNSKLPLDVLRMHIHRQKFCLTNGAPPKVLAIWQISDLRKFGVVDKKFIFEGGSNCGKGKSSAKSFFFLPISPQMCFLPYLKQALSLSYFFFSL